MRLCVGKSKIAAALRGNLYKMRHLARFVRHNIQHLRRDGGGFEMHHDNPPPPPPSNSAEPQNLLSDRECCKFIEDRYFDSLGSLDDVFRDVHLSRSRYNLLLFKAGLSPPDE